MTPAPPTRGPIAWMAANPVAANLLMLVLILGGVLMTGRITQEYLPATEPDTISVTVALPGATPAEVEQSILLSMEQELRAVQGLESLTAVASEGSAKFTAELSGSRGMQQVYTDVQQAVDQVPSLPEDAETPVVRLDVRRRSVIEVHLFGPVDERSLRLGAEQVRAYLLRQPEISQVDLISDRHMEIQVEISQAALRAHDLTLDEVAAIIRSTALERSGGTLETQQGDLLLRLADRRYTALDFAKLPLITDASGTVLRLGDVADVRNGFADREQFTTFNGHPSLRLYVFRVGEETPISVADTVRRVMPAALETLPAALDAAILNDRSEYYRDRMQLLLKNGAIGLGLVLLVLTLFLELRLAFWVAIGIPVAFMGTFFFLPWTGVSLNLVSMFAFIMALGIVVDDAIVAGENIYEYRKRGMERLTAAVQGTRDIAVPLSFSILTNMVAFIPLAMMPGWRGKFFIVIPIVVALAFLISWIEALFVLPAHLAAVRKRGANERPGLFRRVQLVFANGLDRFVERVYGPVLRVAMHWRYATIAAMVASLLVTVAWVDSGRMGWSFFPRIPRDYSEATISMPVGAPLETVRAVSERVSSTGQALIDELGGAEQGVGVYAEIDENRIKIRAYLQPPDIRPVQTREFTAMWRKRVGSVAEARSVRFVSSWGGGGRAAVEVRLSHSDSQALERASADLAARLAEFPQARGIDDGFTPGKAQLEFRLTEAGRAAGLTAEELAAQVRHTFFGAEALAQQEGRNEVKVRVRLPENERRSVSDIETLLIRTPDGGSVPLYEVARAERGRADSSINRENGFRVAFVTANIEPRVQTNQVLAAIRADVLPSLLADHPGLGATFEGRAAAQAATMQGFLFTSVPLALAIIYILLAIPFRSYTLPFVVMMSIPFGFVGAVIGHLIMGKSLSMISVFGIIALGGVVINAGIVMIDYALKQRAAGASAFEAIWLAGQRRFRPILLTTLTTFGGLAPMIWETSRQAQFLIPMAVSLGYGIVFATLIVLFLIPCLFLAFEDLGRFVRGARRVAGHALFPGQAARAPDPDPDPDPGTDPDRRPRPVAAE